MAATQYTMKTLYGKLRAAGYNPKYVRSLLPDWWDDELASTPSGFQEASIRLGCIFGVQPRTLRDPEIPPALRVPEGRKFKRQVNHVEESLDIACALAMTEAIAVLRAMPSITKVSIPNAGAIRRELLESAPYIDFGRLLDYVWKVGIPVIFLKYLPTSAKKMDGLAFESEGRPVIVLTRSNCHGRLVFDLAHELAHIALGHVANGRCIVDQDIDAGADEADERAANCFALELLTGDPDCSIVPRGKYLTATELADAACRFGEKHQIDPLHVALNYGFTQGHWPVAQAAVKLIAQHHPSDQEVLRERLFFELRRHDADEDDLERVRRLAGAADN